MRFRTHTHTQSSRRIRTFFSNQPLPCGSPVVRHPAVRVRKTRKSARPTRHGKPNEARGQEVSGGGACGGAASIVAAISGRLKNRCDRPHVCPRTPSAALRPGGGAPVVDVWRSDGSRGDRQTSADQMTGGRPHVPAAAHRYAYRYRDDDN